MDGFALWPFCVQPSVWEQEPDLFVCLINPACIEMLKAPAPWCLTGLGEFKSFLFNFNLPGRATCCSGVREDIFIRVFLGGREGCFFER